MSKHDDPEAAASPEAEVPEAEGQPASHGRGTNQSGMRARNERLVLSLVRRHGALAKSEIARMTGLSAQTVSVIMRQLEADRLLRRGEPSRGRVGQPLVPLSLDPTGVYFLGAKVGRRSLEFVLVDFLGEVLLQKREAYRYPRAAPIVARLCDLAAEAGRHLGEDAERIAGLGLAMPFELWSWAETIGAPPADMEAWAQTDIRSLLAGRLPYPVLIQNDATAACGAELAFGHGAARRDFIYLFVGAFIGGGLVLNGGLYTGQSGNAAALGSMPVPNGAGGIVQLIERASLISLERRLTASGEPAAHLYELDFDWTRLEPHLVDWISEAGPAIAHAIAATATVVDVEAAVIDGAFPPEVRDRLLRRVSADLDAIDLSGITAPKLHPGTIGPVARALGGASLPLFDRYLVEPHALAAPDAWRVARAS